MRFTRRKGNQNYIYYLIDQASAGGCAHSSATCRCDAKGVTNLPSSFSFGECYIYYIRIRGSCPSLLCVCGPCLLLHDDDYNTCTQIVCVLYLCLISLLLFVHVFNVCVCVGGSGTCLVFSSTFSSLTFSDRDLTVTPHFQLKLLSHPCSIPSSLLLYLLMRCYIL